MITPQQIASAKGMLMNGPMVCAMLADLKTQTRRMDGLAEINRNPGDWNSPAFGLDTDTGNIQAWFIADGDRERFIKSRYQPGDIIYVRETYRIYSADECACYDECVCAKFIGKPIYRADRDLSEAKWTPSARMPKEYARIFLRVTNVRVERVGSISTDDALAEGVYREFDDNGFSWYGDYSAGVPIEDAGMFKGNPRKSFQTLWDSIYQSRGLGWEKSPWVFVHEFERVR